MQEHSERTGPSGKRPSLRTFLQTAFSYRKRSGMWAWLLHRLTGIALVLYLVLHIKGLHSLPDPVAFEAYISTFRSPLFKIAEVMLLGSVAFHAFNGLRIMVQDMFYRSENQRRLYHGVIMLTAAVTLAGGLSLLFPYFIAPLFR
jgi:succinate dehydrogenase / fumarate reductase cytochrome b subunit